MPQIGRSLSPRSFCPRKNTTLKTSSAMFQINETIWLCAASSIVYPRLRSSCRSQLPRLKRQKQPTTSGLSECLASQFWDLIFIAVMQLHHGKHEYKKSAFSIHALTGSPTTGLPDYTGERAHGGRVLLAMNQAKPVRLLGCIRRWKRVVVFPVRRRSAVR